MILGLKRPRKRLRKSPRKSPQKTSPEQVVPGANPDIRPAKKAPTKRRRRVNAPARGPHYFGVKTRLERATGKDKRYKLNAIRALPTTKKDTVILQATDGQQAVCLLSPGKMSSPRLIPSSILPVRNADKGVMVELVDDQWRSSSGRTVEDQYQGETSFPPMSDVLPNFSGQAKSSHIRLGIDLALLDKVAMSLGTYKLTLFIPVPSKPTEGTPCEHFVNKPVAVCPATDEEAVRGVGVVMPLQPKNGVEYFMKVRKLVSASEVRCKAKDKS